MTLAKILYDGAQNGDELVDLIHHLCLILFATPNEELLSGKWSCPLMCYLAVDNMREDGSFNEAHHFTTDLAKWKYAIRNVAFSQAYKKHKLNKLSLLEYVFFSYIKDINIYFHFKEQWKRVACKCL